MRSKVFGQVFAHDHLLGIRGAELKDFFQVALDEQHRANIAYADDHLASPLCSQQSPGHCANNDPQSFRVAVPYFTYQLKPNKKIVTTGVCATPRLGLGLLGLGL